MIFSLLKNLICNLSVQSTLDSLEVLLVRVTWLNGLHFTHLVGHFGYFSPFMYKSTVPSQEYAPQNNQFSGLIIRLDLLSFTTVEILDLTTIDDSLRGFMGGFASKFRRINNSTTKVF